MSWPNTTEHRNVTDESIAQVIQHCLHGKCIELSLFLYHGTLPTLLLDEIVEIATDAWAFRDGGDDA